MSVETAASRLHQPPFCETRTVGAALLWTDAHQLNREEKELSQLGQLGGSHCKARLLRGKCALVHERRHLLASERSAHQNLPATAFFSSTSPTASRRRVSLLLGHRVYREHPRRARAGPVQMSVCSDSARSGEEPRRSPCHPLVTRHVKSIPPRIQQLWEPFAGLSSEPGVKPLHSRIMVQNPVSSAQGAGVRCHGTMALFDRSLGNV